MADPATWIVLSTAAQVGGRVFAGQQAAERSRFDAQVARDNARLRLVQSNEEALAIRRQAVIDFSRARANAAGSGVQFIGSTLDVAAQNAAQAELEARQAMYAGQTQADALNQTARQLRRNARAQLISTGIGIAGDLVSGGMQLSLNAQNQRLMRTGTTAPAPSPAR
jgi:hypothetical protein